MVSLNPGSANRADVMAGPFRTVSLWKSEAMLLGVRPVMGSLVALVFETGFLSFFGVPLHSDIDSFFNRHGFPVMERGPKFYANMVRLGAIYERI